MQGIADDNGCRLTGAPWAFSLAEISQVGGIQKPTVRTIGFQRISEKGIDWLTPRKKNQQQNDNDDEVALSYTMGIYPPPSGQTCEQWRAEGKPYEISISEVLETAPIGSFAQILAVGRVKKNKNINNKNRMILDDKTMFMEQVEQIKKELQAGTIDMEEMESSVRVVRLKPDRMELMISGPIWERFEWTRDGDKWTPKVQLMPY